MKCKIKKTPVLENAVRLEFDRVIPPLFPKPPRPQGRFASDENEKVLFWSNPISRGSHAVRVARLNAGKFHFELVNPAKTYRELFESLSRVDGLVELVDLDRYTLGIQVGGMFSVGEVAREVARLFQQSFYWDEELEWGPGLEVDLPEVLVTPLTTISQQANGDSPKEATQKSSAIGDD